MDADQALATVAALMADPARARMLCSLLDGHARTATELAAVGEIGASTASAHLGKLAAQGLVECMPQGKHRYYRLATPEVGQALEALLVVAGVPRARFEPSTPPALREARRCYDHLAGRLGVGLHDHAQRRGWLLADAARPRAYRLSDEGMAAFAELGLDMAALRGQRRQFACACMDWSERRPHLGGALGAALLTALQARGWFEAELDSRALRVTVKGRRMLAQLCDNAAETC